MPSASSVEKKQSNLLDQVQAKTADRFKKDKTGKSFEDTRMDSTKRAANGYQKFDTNKAEKSFDEMIDFVIKCTLASVKNIDPTSEDSGSKSSEMLGTATAMATVGAAKQQVAKMNEMLEAIKNPGYNALELQGKEVSYDSSKRFDGTNPVHFKYNVNYPEKYKDATVSTIIKVVDSDGKIVYQTKGNGKLGDHNFDWNGCDKKGKKMSAGTYSIEVEGVGFATINGQKVPFHVDATSLKTAVVESVEMQNGVATKLILSNGESIDKSQVVRAKDISKSKNAVELSPDLIGNVIELDLTKAQSIGGDIEVYYDNHIQNPGKATIKISDSKGNLVKTFESDKIKTKGRGTIPFSRTGIESGNYTVEIVVENKDTGASETLSKKPVNLLVKGINYKDNLAITIDENDVEIGFKAYNINAVGREASPLTDRANSYLNERVKYDDSKFKFTGEFDLKVLAKQSTEAGAIVLYEELRIYDQNDKLVTTLQANYNPVDYLDMTSVTMSGEYVNIANPGTPVKWVNFSQLGTASNDQKRSAYSFIEQKLTDGIYKFKDQTTADIFKHGSRPLNFKWDGIFTSGAVAQDGQIFSTRRATFHLKQDGGILPSNPVHMGIGTVVDTDIKDGEIFLLVERDGIRTTIKESQLLDD
jgi:flagellar hook assembly protein FlgD